MVYQSGCEISPEYISALHLEAFHSDNCERLTIRGFVCVRVCVFFVSVCVPRIIHNVKSINEILCQGNAPHLFEFIFKVSCFIRHLVGHFIKHSGLILGLRPANERHRYKVTPSLIGWAQT